MTVMAEKECGCEDHGSWHFDTPHEPAIDGHIGSDRCVFYRHAIDTDCHGVISMEWMFDTESPSDVQVTVLAEKDFTGCRYCQLIVNEAEEPIQQVAMTAFRELHMAMVGHAIDMLVEADAPQEDDSAVSWLGKVFKFLTDEGEGS